MIVDLFFFKSGKWLASTDHASLFTGGGSVWKKDMLKPALDVRLLTALQVFQVPPGQKLVL